VKASFAGGVASFHGHPLPYLLGAALPAFSFGWGGCVMQSPRIGLPWHLVPPGLIS